MKKIEETKKEPVTRKVVDLKKQEDKLVPPGTGVFCYFFKGVKIAALNVNNKCIATGIFYQIYLFLMTYGIDMRFIHQVHHFLFILASITDKQEY